MMKVESFMLVSLNLIVALCIVMLSDCPRAECNIFNVMLNVVMLTVALLTVMAPFFQIEDRNRTEDLELARP